MIKNCADPVPVPGHFNIGTGIWLKTKCKKALFADQARYPAHS
jgi:hypothetical protein